MLKGGRLDVLCSGIVVTSGLLWIVWQGRKKENIIHDWIQVHCEMIKLLVQNERSAQKKVKLGPKRRLKRLLELIALLKIERQRRLEVAEAKRKYPDDPNAIYRLNSLKHVTTQRQLRKISITKRSEAEIVADMMEKQMKAKSAPTVCDVVLIGGGHSHVHVIRMLGMVPIPGVRVTLISKDIETPYSGMLPGHIAGYYTRSECHIDLGKLARFAGIQMIHAEVTKIDFDNQILKIRDINNEDRPSIYFDVLSINVGITPNQQKEVQSITPVKPIAKFAKAWDQLLLEKIESKWIEARNYDIVVVGGGAGGVELILAMRARVRNQLQTLGRDPDLARFSLLTRGDSILGSHSQGVRLCMLKVLEERQITIISGCEALGASKPHPDSTQQFLECRFADTQKIQCLPYDECVWCTQASAPKFLATSGLKYEENGGFVLIDEYQRCSLAKNNITLDHVFAAGDCASVQGHPRPKAGVFAVMAGMALFENIQNATMNAKKPKRHIPQSSFLGLIGTGDGSCIASRGELAFEANWLWSLKDWIDRKWMWQYSGGLPDLDLAEEKIEGAFQSSLKALDILKRSPMRCGGCGAKVGANTLSRALASLPPSPIVHSNDIQILVGVNEPDDGAVVKYQATTLVHSIDFFRNFLTDPYLLGRVAANHALSDCEAMGAKPITALALVVIPYGNEKSQGFTLEALMHGIRKTLDQADCALVGGHTCEGSELSVGLSINGLTPNNNNKLFSKGGFLPGDVLILTKPIGTGCIMAADMRAKANYPYVQATINSMLQSNRAASNIFISHEVHACTDITGFGLIGHLNEMCRASKGALIDINLSDIPFLPGALTLAQKGIFSSLQPENLNARRAVINHDAVANRADYALLFDPQTAGGLLAAVNASDAQAVVHRLKAAGYPHAAVIGVVQDTESSQHFPAAINIRLPPS